MTLSDDQRQTREAQQADDVERLNAAAERLNAEMAEVLEFQSAWPGAEWGSDGRFRVMGQDESLQKRGPGEAERA